MTAKLLGSFINNSPEWHQARAGRIGGSDVGTIMGWNPWCSAYTLHWQKLGQLPAVETNSAMALGTALEAPIRDFFFTQNPSYELVETGNTYQDSNHADWIANPDALIRDHAGRVGVLEIKHTSAYWDEIPKHYLAQVLWYCHIMDAEYAIIAAVTAGRYTEHHVRYADHLETIAEITEAVERFSLGLQMEVPPQWDGSDSTYETVRTLSPGIIDAEINLGYLYVDLFAAKVIAEEAAKVFNAKKAETLALMNGAQIGLFEGNPVIKLQARNGKPFITFK